MSTEGASKKQKYDLSVRSTDLDAPTLVDRIAGELLDHLCVCATCLAVFAAQEESLERAGCTEGIRIVSHSQLKWEEHRAGLALDHVTEDVLDDYLFGRLTGEEESALDHHAAACLACAGAILNRKILIDSIKSAARASPENTPAKPATAGAISIRVPAYSFGITHSITSGRTHAVVIVNRNNHLPNLTRSQLKFFFLRIISHWPWGAEVLPIDLAEESELYVDFVRRVLRLEPAQIDSYWFDRKSLQGRQRPLVASSPNDVKWRIAANTGAIGYVSASDLDETVRVIEVT